jgi:hypothetical protein
MGSCLPQIDGQHSHEVPAAHDFGPPLPQSSVHAPPFPPPSPPSTAEPHVMLHLVEPEQVTVHPPVGHVASHVLLP